MKHWLILAAMLAAPVHADEAEDAFVDANLLSIFYHELGHAMIDVLALPVFGQEEDAADVASILLIDVLWDAESALDLAYDASFGFAAEAMEQSEAEDVAFWDVHGPDQQRFFNTVCLFYGADPEGRADFAEDMDLPEERAETCEEEFDLANESWGPIWDELATENGSLLGFEAAAGATYSAGVIGAEVEALNAQFHWPQALLVETDTCDEPNAFYDPSRLAITICEEFEPYLRQLYRDWAD
ncbi:DUF4344 domain-containing metallopeptidase [Pseudoprimorskyibacter insulae]|uniref:Metallopeptidase n=1 Tax=Pseudoprimorskyibacter insulae TaxID=1695997 RepID=A0A2R8APN4_9RHOB|nr:DUF4344 domain-containing metallopeptidase [Pseudoprimorskyibacter insulae]SPF77829.1 hypothetical protein PRI8871_00415 [Pseudoprimorskyibacter insulae]